MPHCFIGWGKLLIGGKGGENMGTIGLSTGGFTGSAHSVCCPGGGGGGGGDGGYLKKKSSTDTESLDRCGS